MDTNKILSADILDLVFNDRNKEYGAYELRKTYPRRITKSLLITALVAGLLYTGSVLAGKLNPEERNQTFIDTVTLMEIPDEIPDPLPEPERREPLQTRTEPFTAPVIVPNAEVVEPPPDQDDLALAKIDTRQQDGVEDNGFPEAPVLDDKNGIIEPQNNIEPDIYPVVQIPAKYDGSWEKFLTRNLNANVPVENGAPAGAYKIIIRFVVDKEGNVSDIQALTSHGYGMEQEAIRVLKKAKGWKAGIQDGREVKSYHNQPITFIVEEE